MNKKQPLIIAAIALLGLLGAGMSAWSTASVEARSGLATGTNAPAPAPTPKKREFPTGPSTDTVQQPAGLKGTIKFSASGQQLQALQCSDLEVRINKASETVATAQASGNFSNGRCSFNISGLPANVALALVIPKPDWVPSKCSQLQFDNQAIAVPPLKPGVTKPVVVTIKTLKCSNI